MDVPELTDGEITLRAVREDDAATIHDLLHDSPEICEWTRIPWPYTREHADEWIERVLVAASEGTEAGLMVTEHGRIVGGTGVMRIGAAIQPRSSLLANEVGYWLHRSARGRGVATRALTLATGWALGPLECGVVRLQVHDGNDVSRRVAERAGYTYLGVVEASDIDDDDHRSHRYEKRPDITTHT